MESYLQQRKERIHKYLASILPAVTIKPERLHEAMRYAVLNGGKRLRPLLVYATGETLGLKLSLLDIPACAVELLHCYSLVHDDLPAMDNDDLRRGLPTCHRAFDEASAILAGGALQSLAFAILAEAKIIAPNIRLKILEHLAIASGSQGMAGGQALDLAAVGKVISLDEVTKMYQLKTGALISASIKVAALLGKDSLTAVQVKAIDNFANHLGLAFQIQDDIFDIETPTTILGKSQGADELLAKPTYPKVAGLTKAKAQVKKLYAAALAQLPDISLQAEPLRILANYMVARCY